MPGAHGRTGLLGREKEQAELVVALSLALQGEPQVVVVAGDAGAGKTTLVADLTRRAEELGFAVAVGHCLDIEADISFAAAVEAVGALIAQIEVLDSRPLARRMRALLDPATPRSAEPLHFLDDLRLAVLEAAAAGPVLVVLEDLHWADESTRDLATALGRTARGRLLFALTVRSDDLHRRHPARKALAEIGRVPGGRRVELGPLSRESIAAMVGSITGESPDAALVRSVMDRSEGNPLYAEEIATAGQSAIPDQLSDLFLARLDALPDGARELARTASVDGTHVDVDTLGELVGVDRERLNAHLRELLDANVMRQVGDSLQFRHGLIREAVYDDLLPDERTRLHHDLATILQSRVDADPEPRLSLLSRLAYHWSAAHDLPRALLASCQAGRGATDLGMAESVVHLDRVLALWDRVPDAETLVGNTKIELVLWLAKATLDQGDGQRWHSLTSAAVDMVEADTDPLVASKAYSSFAFSSMFNDPAKAAAAVRLAAEYAGDVPTEQRAFVLAAQALLNNANNQYAAGLDAAGRAIRASREAAAVDPLLLALMFKAGALQYLGRVSESLEAWDDAIQVARKEGRLVETLDRVHHMASRLIEFGQVDLGVELARAGDREGQNEGLVVSAASCRASIVVALT
ncbi:MAG TPA: AAA family ATPase, partial [Nocardioides sp.]|nr:AAA family ATPase [Nocardioides sp.]